MKIKSDEETIVLPIEESHLSIIISNPIRDKVIEYLTSYFANKKKNLCAVYDDDGSLIVNKDIDFIYIPYKTLNMNNFVLKEKSEFNQFISSVIENNLELFGSIENIRQSLYELVTDSGFYKIEKILTKGLNSRVDISLKNFNTSSLIGMLEINQDYLSESEKYCMIYNVLLYLSRRASTTIIFIDFPIDDIALRWIENLNDKIFVVLDNLALGSELPIETSVIRLGSTNEIDRYEFSNTLLKRVLYLNHPFISENIELQTQENIKMYKQFADKSITFLAKFTAKNSREAL